MELLLEDCVSCSKNLSLFHSASLSYGPKVQPLAAPPLPHTFCHALISPNDGHPACTVRLRFSASKIASSVKTFRTNVRILKRHKHFVSTLICTKNSQVAYNNRCCGEEKQRNCKQHFIGAFPSTCSLILDLGRGRKLLPPLYH